MNEVFLVDNLLMKKENIKIHMLKSGCTIEESIREEFSGHEIHITEQFKYIHEVAEFDKQRSKLILSITDEQRQLRSSKDKLLIFREIIIKEEPRIYLISIGDTREIFDIYKTEINFGLKIGINDVLDNGSNIELKELQSKNKTNGDNYRHGKNSFKSLHNFTFRRVTDILKEMKIKRKFDNSSQIWTLNRGITFPVDSDSDINELVASLDKFILANYTSEKYKSEYDFLNDLSITDPDTTKILFDIIENDVTNSSFNGGFAWPSFENDDHSFFTIDNDQTQLFTLENEGVQKILFPLKKNLFNVNVYSWADISKDPIDCKPLSKIIFCEIQHNGKTYTLNEGVWYEISEQFANKIHKEYLNLKKSDIIFSDWVNDIDEGTYNDAIVKQNKWTLLDKKNINFDNRSKLELADIAIIPNNSLVAVKRGDVSSGISHLVAQVKNSMYAILHDTKKVNELINNKLGNEYGIDLEKINKFVLAIGTRDSENNLPKMPFFAKLSIYDLLNFNNSVRFQLEIAWIKIVD